MIALKMNPSTIKKIVETKISNYGAKATDSKKLLSKSVFKIMYIHWKMKKMIIRKKWLDILLMS